VEYDDELSPIWIKNGIQYSESYPEVGIFLPIVYETDENGRFISFTNESVWAKDFTEQSGYLDNNTLQRVQNFNFDGMVVNKELFLEHGGLKKNIKLTFTYEFLLRMSYLSIPIMVIPKLGYKHTNNREGSLFVEYKNTIDVLESKFWVNKAKKEYFFTEDREITYEP
jgi:GT2 family glycosyltransferase